MLGLINQVLLFSTYLPKKKSLNNVTCRNGALVYMTIVRGVGCASGVRLPPAALSPSFLDKRVGTSLASA